MITLNGQKTEIKDGMTLLSLLEGHAFRVNLIAVEHNGKIVRKDEYGKTVIRNGDTIEVVSFIGGG